MASGPADHAPPQSVLARAGLRGSAVVLALLLGLAGCTLIAPTPTPEEQAAEARRLLDSGQAEAALARYRSLAAEAESPEAATRYRLAGAEAAVELGDPATAQALLRAAPRTGDASLDFRVALRRATLAERRGQPIDADPLADPPEGLPSELERQRLRLLARHYDATNRYAAAIRTRVTLEGYLNEAEAIKANRDALWQTLSRRSERELQRIAAEAPGDGVAGWVALARAGNDRVALRRWLIAYPGHPAADRRVYELLGVPPGEFDRRPRRFALILPASGPYREAAEAIREGFLAALYEATRTRVFADGAPGFRATLYDAPGEPDPEALEALYERALAEGAEFVIGPLLKEHVAPIAASAPVAIPTLTLNWAPEPPSEPGNLFQFGLAPEDEGRQIALTLSHEGVDGVALLVADDPRAERIAEAFARVDGGLEVIGQRTLPQRAEAIGRTIAELFRLPDSKARHRALEAALQRELAFVPRAAARIDALVLLAGRTAARQVIPQLIFQDVDTRIPRFGSQTLLGWGGLDEGDPDLAGLRVTTLRWDGPRGESRIAQALRTRWPERMASPGFRKLFALGVDAFELSQRLPNLPGAPAEGMSGALGQLYLGAHQRIHRWQPWIEIGPRSGRPLASDYGLSRGPQPRPSAGAQAPGAS